MPPMLGYIAGWVIGKCMGDVMITRDEIKGLMGDLLFVMANLARHLGVEPETALQETNAKFIRRFQGVEKHAAEQERGMREMSLDELDELWKRVKDEEA